MSEDGLGIATIRASPPLLSKASAAAITLYANVPVTMSVMSSSFTYNITFTYDKLLYSFEVQQLFFYEILLTGHLSFPLIKKEPHTNYLVRQPH